MPQSLGFDFYEHSRVACRGEVYIDDPSMTPPSVSESHYLELYILQSLSRVTHSIITTTFSKTIHKHPNTMCGLFSTIFYETYELWDLFLYGLGGLMVKLGL